MPVPVPVCVFQIMIFVYTFAVGGGSGKVIPFPNWALVRRFIYGYVLFSMFCIFRILLAIQIIVSG